MYSNTTDINKQSLIEQWQIVQNEQRSAMSVSFFFLSSRAHLN